VPQIDRRAGKRRAAVRRILNGKLDRERNALGGAREIPEARADVAADDSALAENIRTVRAVAGKRPGRLLRDARAVPGRGAAGDYLMKPFALEELLARLRALLRRTSGGNGELLFADLALDPGTREVRRGGRQLELTVTEFNLLELFLRNPRQVLRRSLIYDRVWGYDFGPDSHALDVYVGYLRRKLEAGGEPRLIHTVRGVGYALREP
jgi:two-component system response regulator MprA